MKYRVPVVVFAEVDAVDEHDAASIAERGVTRGLARGSEELEEVQIKVTHPSRETTWIVVAERARALNSALRNGLVHVTADPEVRRD